MEKSKQKPLPKAKAIFNLYFPTEKIKTEVKIKTLAIGYAVLIFLLLLRLSAS